MIVALRALNIRPQNVLSIVAKDGKTIHRFRSHMKSYIPASQAGSVKAAVVQTSYFQSVCFALLQSCMMYSRCTLPLSGSQQGLQYTNLGSNSRIYSACKRQQ